MAELLKPLDTEPVSVYPPFVTYPGGQYRHEYAPERRAALEAALAGVVLGSYDRLVLHWLSWRDLARSAAVVSLILRARRVAAEQARGGGESR